jgi:O-antigen ligase
MVPRRKYVFRFSFAVGLVFLLLTRSRSSIIGLGVGLLIYFLVTRSIQFKIWLLLGFGAVSVMLYFVGLLNPIVDLLSRSGEGSENLTGRIPLWQECWDFAKAHLFVGYGYQDFWTPHHIDYFSAKFHWAISAAHSAYLEALLTLGLVGVVLHTAVLVVGIFRGAICYRTTGSQVYALLISLCVVYLIVGTLEAILVVTVSPVAFYFSLLLFTLCFRERTAAVLH